MRFRNKFGMTSYQYVRGNLIILFVLRDTPMQTMCEKFSPENRYDNHGLISSFDTWEYKKTAKSTTRKNAERITDNGFL